MMTVSLSGKDSRVPQLDHQLQRRYFDLQHCEEEKGTIPGQALGVVTLKDIVPFQRKHLKGAMMDEFSPEDYAWILTNPRVIKPYPVKGKLSLWTCEHEIEYLPVPKNEKEDEELGRIYWDPIIYKGEVSG